MILLRPVIKGFVRKIDSIIKLKNIGQTDSSPFLLIYLSGIQYVPQKRQAMTTVKLGKFLKKTI